MFDRLADRPVWEERPPLRTHHIPTALSAHIEESLSK